MDELPIFLALMMLIITVVGLFWGCVEAHQCKTYGTREYTTVLMNLPTNWDGRFAACKATPLELHGVTHLPRSCEDKVGGICWNVGR